jgi:hypothetical protein
MCCDSRKEAVVVYEQDSVDSWIGVDSETDRSSHSTSEPLSAELSPSGCRDVCRSGARAACTGSSVPVTIRPSTQRSIYRHFPISTSPVWYRARSTPSLAPSVISRIERRPDWKSRADDEGFVPAPRCFGAHLASSDDELVEIVLRGYDPVPESRMPRFMASHRG